MNQTQISQPIDKLAISLIVLLALIMGLLIWGGNTCDDRCLFHTGARVNNFSWQDRIIGGQDRAFILTFNRPMDRLSVEKNLNITPPLPGKVSWSGLRLAYTLDKPAPYGKTYHISLSGARERFPNQEQLGEEIQPFQAEFKSRDRVLVYIGTQGEEEGRLVLYNWTRQQKTILTPKNLTVFDFQPYPQGDDLLFSAAETALGLEGIGYLKLYKVPAQLNPRNNITAQIKLILDNQNYQNNKFAITQDGKTIVVQRLDRNNPDNYGLWKIDDQTETKLNKRSNSPQLITDAQIGDFLLTPDSQTVAVAQGEGIALLPLKAQAEAIDFLPRFGQVLDFSADGRAAAMIDYNTDSKQLKYTQSLIYLNNQGIQKELLNTSGSIQNCQFEPTAKRLYCWLTELEIGEEYVEKPYLAEINLATGIITSLVSVPQYQESQLSIAPDGLGILFERSPDNISANASINQQNTMWLLSPQLDATQPNQINVEQLPFTGLNPQWLP